MSDDPDLSRIRRYFDLRIDPDDARVKVDDITASDLLLHRAYEKMDRTLTNAGQSVLYGYMRTPCTTADELNDRTARLELFRENAGLRTKLRKALSRIGRSRFENLEEEIWAGKELDTVKYLLPLRLWMAFSVAAILTPAFIGFQGIIFMVLPVLIVNMIVTVRAKRNIGEHMESLMYLFRLLGGTGKVLEAIAGNGFPEENELRTAAVRLKKIRKNGKFLTPLTQSGGDPISLLLEFFKFFFLQELHAFLSTFHLLESLRPDLARLYEIVGSTDACSAVAEYLERDGTDACRAQVAENASGIDFTGLVHPLIEDCVGNSLALSKSIILTGTNMSGKSTFLRTLGLNQLFAVCFGFAYARSFATGFYPVISSISTQDDLLTHTSKYFAEAKRLLTVIRTVIGGDRAYLVLVDEILSGTNSEDRIRASVRILEKLAGAKGLTVSATHDLEIARSLSGVYDNFHFSERVGKETLEFDYTIKTGIVDQRNALRILSYLGYPDDILDSLSLPS